MYTFDNGDSDEGQVRLYLGSATGLAATPAWTGEGSQTEAYYGQSTSSAGDVNGDGYGDIVVGAFDFDNGETNEGRAFLYYGSPSILAPTAAWTAESNQADEHRYFEPAPASPNPRRPLSSDPLTTRDPSRRTSFDPSIVSFRPHERP